MSSSPAVNCQNRPDALPGLERSVVIIGGALFVVLMALASRYGFDRDELYFLDAGRHLQGGYVDQPLLAPLLARASLDLFGISLPGLRVWPALAGWATVIVAGLIARESGGRARAQRLAALGTATMPVLLAVDHLAGPTAFDMLAWATLALVILRLGRTGDQRWWLLAGAVLGLGLTNKHSIGLFAIAILAGTLLSGGARDLPNRWLATGALIAVAFSLPDAIWQASHGWATLSMTRQLNAENGGLHNAANWVVGQLLMTTLALIGVWVGGLRELWRSPRPLWRGLAWAYLLLFVFFALTTGAKIYYLAGAYVYLLAVGAVRLDAWLGNRSGRTRVLGVGMIATTCLALPLVLPVLPAGSIGWTYAINQVPGESIGWPRLVSQVRAAWLSLPSTQRSHAVIFTANYGEAGAINELGRDSGLPTAVSGQNSEWWWGPGDPHATTVLAVSPGPRDLTGYDVYLRKFFARVQMLATFTNAAGIHNQEWGGHIYLCTRPKQAWFRMWPRLRHYD